MNNFRIYRANKNSNGTASQFDFNPKIKSVFLELAKQTNSKDDRGNPRFDWENKISVKLDALDMSEILLVIYGRKKGIGIQKNGAYQGLYHKNKDGDAIIRFEKHSSNLGFYLKVSVRKNNVKTAIDQTVSDSEGMIIKIVFEDAIRRIYT